MQLVDVHAPVGGEFLDYEWDWCEERVCWARDLSEGGEDGSQEGGEERDESEGEEHSWEEGEGHGGGSRGSGDGDL